MAMGADVVMAEYLPDEPRVAVAPLLVAIVSLFSGPVSEHDW